jgi:ribonuclease D
VTELDSPRYIDTPAALLDWVDRLKGITVVAVDTESDSFHHYREKVCLIQMTANGEDAIVDPLALDSLEPLRAMLADENVTKIFHDAGYDLMCLRRDYNFEVTNIFDTMLASRLMGRKSFGLAAILQERFGFTANKRLQRSDWAMRPLTDEQLDYARFDTHFLPQLAEQLETELAQAKRLSWALEDFARLSTDATARVTAREARPDTDAFWRLKGIKTLTPQQRGRAMALFLLREKIAERLDRPPFKVFGEPVLIDLAKRPPRSASELGPRPGLRRAGIERFGAEILNALQDAEPLKDRPPPGVGRRRRSGRFLDPTARQRYEALRELRRAKAEEIGIDPEVTLANATLESIAKDPPASMQALLGQAQLRGWREPIFAQAILNLLGSGAVAEQAAST